MSSRRRRTPRAAAAPKPIGPAAPAPIAVWPAVLACVVLLAITAAVYAPVRHYPFVSYDDPDYITDNTHVTSGLSWSNVSWSLTSGYAANWHPVTWISHMIDVQAYGLNAGGHHVTSVAFHLANTLLLFAVLLHATRALAPSALVAALFALHPMHVESVAWISERKDVLSAFFGLVALWAYVRYTRRPTLAAYAMVVAAFALGLAAKPMLITLPALLLLLDFWPLGRAGTARAAAAWPKLIREKIPLFALAAASAVVTFVVQRQGGSVTTLAGRPLEQRVDVALTSYVAYVWKTVWPTGLAIIYPFRKAISGELVVGSVVLLALATFAAWKARRRYPYAIVGWVWFVVTLVPVIGLVQIGDHFMADRYTYMASIGLFLIAAWGAADCAARFRGWRVPIAAAGAIVVGLSAVQARTQLGYWSDNVRLWSHALDVTTDNYGAHNNLAVALAGQGKIDEAIGHFEEAARIRPYDPDLHVNAAVLLDRRGRTSEAVQHLEVALKLSPENVDARRMLARLKQHK